MGTRISIEPKLEPTVLEDVYDENEVLFNEVHANVCNMKNQTETIIPFPVEPSLRRGTSDEAYHKIEYFNDSPSLRLKHIGESSGFIPAHFWIYRHDDGDVFTFWRKNHENYAIKPYIQYPDDILAAGFFETLVLPPGAGIPP